MIKKLPQQRSRRIAIGAGAVVILAFTASCSYLSGFGKSGWEKDHQVDWYTATQGSRLIPSSWFDALQRSDADMPFANTDYLTDAFGFVAAPDSMSMSLPIGFTHDRQDTSDLTVTNLQWYEGQPTDEKNAETWLGLNCAACHTGKIHYKGEELIVDGGPNLLDFQLFVEELDNALIATRDNPQKWDSFSAAVLENKDTPANRSLLENSFDQFLGWQQRTDAMNETPMRYGFGRLDAVGHILNKILMFSGAPESAGNEANAPVSYPFLWNIWRQERVQWNGVASNSRIKLPGDSLEYGALGRNAGEVLGVFGDINIQPASGTISDITGFPSSIRAQNLMRLELKLHSLDPPEWPSFFPSIDKNLARRGEALFDQKCASCHLPESQWQDDQPTERMISFFDTHKNNPEDLTDIWMACNAYLYDGPSGTLEGRKTNEGEIFTQTAPVVDMLAASVKGALINDAGSLVKEGFNNFFGIRRPPVIDAAEDPFAPARAAEINKCLTTEGVLVLGYKARPLDGIWATAPYLHNGSVSSLYELLLPAEQRQETFWTGNREYDPLKVGYVTDPIQNGAGFEFKTRDEQGKMIAGNSNAGHEYGAANFSENDRAALLEYMKGL